MMHIELTSVKATRADLEKRERLILILGNRSLS